MRCVILSLSGLFFVALPSPSRIFPLSLHDALPISASDLVLIDDLQSIVVDIRLVDQRDVLRRTIVTPEDLDVILLHTHRDRKSTRLNSSHVAISYAVFCLKKKRKSNTTTSTRRRLS